MSRSDKIDACLTAILALCDKENTSEGNAIKMLTIQLSALIDEVETREENDE